MQFASDVDAAVARLERRGGLTLAGTSGAVTPEVIKAGQRRARELRAQAISGFFTALLCRRRAQRESRRSRSGVLTVG